MSTPSMQTLIRRIEALEARLADIEGGYGRTLYQLRRDTVGLTLAIGTILGHLGLTSPTGEQIDAILDDES